MSSTSITYTLQKSNSVEQLPQGNSGYRVIFTVTSAENIDTAIFVRQREVAVASQDNFIDSFYTVASVADMNELPAGFSSMDHPFYRTASVELVFGNLSDLDKYVGVIQRMIEQLKAANDLAINMQESETIHVPPIES